MEASFQNFFEVWAYASTIVFARPSQFRYPALISVIAVFVAGALYAAYSRGRRGHLLHLSLCAKCACRGPSKGSEHDTNFQMQRLQEPDQLP